MNYYKHHIGDYQSDTSHLSWDEDIAYRRMIDVYYKRELPMPIDVKEVCRLVRAVTKAQQQAVETVLTEFFELHDDGWHQKRCDEELARFSEKSEKAKQSALSRWGSGESDSEVDANAMRTHSEGNANHKPLTNNHKPLTNKTHNANAVALTDVFQVLDFLNQKTGKAFQLKNPAGKPTANALKIRDRLKDGYTVQQCKTVIARKCREWDTDKMRHCLTPETLFRKSNFDKYIGECVADA